jgi:CBS domain-containing protein
MKQICDFMSTPVLSVESNTTVREASLYMFKCKVGSMLVKEYEEYIGILTEADINHKLVSRDLSPEATLVTEIMTRPVLTIAGDLPISEANSFMAQKKIRHLAVVLDGKITGMFSIQNLVNYYANHLGE